MLYLSGTQLLKIVRQNNYPPDGRQLAQWLRHFEFCSEGGYVERHGLRFSGEMPETQFVLMIDSKRRSAGGHARKMWPHFAD